jgi:hypothetical protein
VKEQQAKELYESRGAKDCGHLSTDRDLVNHQLQNLFAMNETLNKNLTLIQEVATKALDELKNSTERFSGVNYADLRVVDVWVKYSIHEEDLEYGVLIEECSPTAYDLQDYMLEYLKDNLPNNLGWSIYVELDW